MNGYQSIDHAAHKAKAKAAFSAYEEAVRAGDAELANATRKRFLEASKALTANRLALTERRRK